MMEMKEQTGSRKKFLVPVVVLMLCLVALTGAAYAYASTLSVSSNTVEAKTLSLDLATGAVDSTSNPVNDQQIITFTDNFDYAGDAKTNDIKYELKSPVTLVTYKLLVKGDADFNTFKVSSSNLADLELFNSVKSADHTKVSDLYNLAYTVGTTQNGTDVVASTALGTVGASFTTKTATAEGVTLWVNVIATAKSTPTETPIEEDVNAKAVGAHTAKTYADAVELLSFSLKFEASMVVTP